MRFDGAMLFVKDLNRMTAFYRDVLGLQPIEETRLADWVEFEGDGGRFSLHAIPSDIAQVLLLFVRDRAAFWRDWETRAARPCRT